jgi:hypothetical protein
MKITTIVCDSCKKETNIPTEVEFSIFGHKEKLDLCGKCYYKASKIPFTHFIAAIGKTIFEALV